MLSQLDSPSDMGIDFSQLQNIAIEEAFHAHSHLPVSLAECLSTSPTRIRRGPQEDKLQPHIGEVICIHAKDAPIWLRAGYSEASRTVTSNMYTAQSGGTLSRVRTHVTPWVPSLRAV
jgi:hypothetical protein